jgi:hypothetical protein
VILAAAVLMHSITYIGRWRSNLNPLTARQQPSPQAGPSTFVRPRLQPIQIFPVDLQG